MDAIGDYVIFRNFLEHIKNTGKYKGFKITLIGNELWKDLALSIDKDNIDHFIGVSPHIQKDYWQWGRFMRLIAALPKQEAVISYHYSRTFFTDLIAGLTRADEKITFKGDESFLSPIKRKLGNKIYSTLIAVPNSGTHEFDRCKSFTSALTGMPVNFNAPYISGSLSHFTSSYSKANNYILVGPAAGMVFRQMEEEQFVYALTLLAQAGYTLCFAGTTKDAVLIEKLISALPGNTSTLSAAGKTTLPELLELVNNSQAVLCYDSSIYHIARALNKPVVCFAGGGHFERFVNYTYQPSSALIVNYPMPCYNCNWECKFYADEKNLPFPCMKMIDHTAIQQGIDNLLAHLQTD